MNHEFDLQSLIHDFINGRRIKALHLWDFKPPKPWADIEEFRVVAVFIDSERFSY